MFCATFAEVVQELARDYLEAIKLERKSLEMELKVLCGGCRMSGRFAVNNGAGA